MKAASRAATSRRSRPPRSRPPAPSSRGCTKEASRRTRPPFAHARTKVMARCRISFQESGTDQATSSWRALEHVAHHTAALRRLPMRLGGGAEKTLCARQTGTAPGAILRFCFFFSRLTTAPGGFFAHDRTVCARQRAFAAMVGEGLFSCARASNGRGGRGGAAQAAKGREPMVEPISKGGLHGQKALSRGFAVRGLGG